MAILWKPLTEYGRRHLCNNWEWRHAAISFQFLFSTFFSLTSATLKHTYYIIYYTIATVIVIRRVDACVLQGLWYLCVCVCVLAGRRIGNTNELLLLASAISSYDSRFQTIYIYIYQSLRTKDILLYYICYT